MPTYAPADITSKPIPSAQGQAIVYDGYIPALAAVCATGDKLNYCVIPAGTRLSVVAVNVSTAYGTAAPTQWVLQPLDGSASTQLVAAGDTVLNTVNRKELVFHPVTVSEDSYLQAVVGTVTSGAAGVSSAVAIGVANGAA